MNVCVYTCVAICTRVDIYTTPSPLEGKQSSSNSLSMYACGCVYMYACVALCTRIDIYTTSALLIHTILFHFIMKDSDIILFHFTMTDSDIILFHFTMTDSDIILFHFTMTDSDIIFVTSRWKTQIPSFSTSR
jgi:hypothetical protein